MPQKLPQLFFYPRYASFEIFRISLLAREIFAHCEFREFSFLAKMARKHRFRGKCLKNCPNYFFNPDMPVLKFYEYLYRFAKYLHIANFANFVFWQ